MSTVEHRYAHDEAPTRDEWRDWFTRVLRPVVLSAFYRKLLAEAAR